MRKLLTIIALLCTVVAYGQQMSWEQAYQKADEIIAKLTPEQKCMLTHGYNKFFTPEIEGAGIPKLYMTDATCGVRIMDLPDNNIIKQLDRSTQFPAPIMLASTFNPSLAYSYAKSVGEECQIGGVTYLLGPGVNIYRNSQCGRNFEYMGEDPFLAARMAEQYVTGMQSTGTVACMKHFLANNTELYRRRSNSIVDERAIMEIYTPAFKAGIDANLGSIMTSYNLVNGEWAGQSKDVITHLLRERLGFKGFVMTDWHSIYDWKKTILSGQNMDMPGEVQFHYTDSALSLLQKGEVTESDIENMIRPQIATAIRYGLYEKANIAGDHILPQEMADNHCKLCYQTAEEGTVLLKNNGVLPLSTSKKILLTGRWAEKTPHGGGSSQVKGYDVVTCLDAIKGVCGQVKCIKNPTAAQIKEADVVICATGTLDAEAVERYYTMAKADENLVRLCVENNKNSIIIISAGSGVDMRGWHDGAAAILYGWYPGQNGYKAIADILVGKVNPSGKLPMTIEHSFADSPAANTPPKGINIAKAKNNPNELFVAPYDVNYTESVLVGYRWYQTKNIEPYYYFGYGLSYTTFNIDNAKIINEKKANEEGKIEVKVDVTNTGKVDGKEVVQLYVGEDKPTCLRPVKELKAFEKVAVKAGEKRSVTLSVPIRNFAFWNDFNHCWQVNSGNYTITIGNSSNDASAVLHFKVDNILTY